MSAPARQTGGAGLAVVGTALLAALAAGTALGSCGPKQPTPTPSERPLQTGIQPASPP